MESPPVATTDPADTVVQRALIGNGLPTGQGWWSFDEKCATTTVYNTLNLPATANGSKLNGAGCAEGQIGRAVSFDGINDSVDIPDRANLHFSTAMTISAWVKPTTAGTAGHIAGKWESPNSYRLSLTAGKPVFSLTFPGGGSGTLVSVTAPAALPTTAYSHLAGVYDGAAMRLYVNGVQVASTSRTGAMVNSNAPIRVGKLPSGSPFKGNVDELRLYNTALTAVQASRLATGLPHRRIRAVAFDPKLAGSTQRMHTHPLFVAEGWRAPEVVLQWWTEQLNASAGEQLYLPEDGDYLSATKFVEEIPWNNITFPNACNYTPGNDRVIWTAEQYIDSVVNNVPRPRDIEDIYRAFKANNPALNFDLIADANGQYFHEMIAISLPGPGWTEGTMVANTNDHTAYISHDGILRDPGLQMNKKFIFHGVGFAQENTNYEQFAHRVEAIMSHAFSPVASVDPALDPCGTTGVNWHPYARDIQDYMTPWDLFTTSDTDKDGDQFIAINEAHVGDAHTLPNSPVEYIRTARDQVSSNYQFWTTFPQNYPFDLTKRNRRVTVSCETWNGATPCEAPDGDLRAWAWQMNLMPKTDGTTDGRSNNWWKYISNPNYQVGRGLPTSKPVAGPFHGAMDLSLTVQQHAIVLRWKTHVQQLGTYQVQWSTDRVNWSVLANNLPGTTKTWQGGLPQPWTDTFYRVRWTNGATTLYSDQLGANVGGATAVDVSGGQRPPVNPTISLYQQGVPYVRWEIPSSCGLGNSDPHAPCEGNTCGFDNVCRDPNGNRVPDYHSWTARYELRKREIGGEVIRVIDRIGHHSVTAADPAAVPGVVFGYRAMAYTDSGQGTTYGQSDMVLAVAGQATVGY